MTATRPLRLVVRAAKIDDLDALTQLVVALNRHQGNPTEPMTRGRLMADLFGGDPWFEARVAVVGTETAGYAFFHRAYETGFAARGVYVHDLFVVEHLRGRGIGRALIAAVARSARARGASYVWWASKSWNREAHAAYARLGGVAEPVMAHAVFGPAFEKLADEG